MALSGASRRKQSPSSKDISHGIKGAAGYGVVYKDGHGRLHNDPSRAISQMAATNHYDTGSEGGWTYFDANP